MKRLTRDELVHLSEQQGNCTSLFMPTHRGGPEMQQDLIRFRQLLERAKEQWMQQGLRASDAAALLAPMRELASDGLFWRESLDGLAVLCCSDSLQTYRLPWSSSELVVTSSHLHLTPLLPFLLGGARFYVLALSKNRIQLYRREQESLYEMAMPGVPSSLAEALQYDELEKQTGFRTISRAPGGGSASAYYGRGIKPEDEREELLRFCQQVNAGVIQQLKDERAPLVLASVDSLAAIYRTANTYRALWERGVSGNPDKLAPAELYAKARLALAPWFGGEVGQALERYAALRGTGLASSDIEEIVSAAQRGRVDTLFLNPQVQVWGRLDPATGAVLVSSQAAGEDLLNLAARFALAASGELYALDAASMPHGASIAALFRY